MTLNALRRRKGGDLDAFLAGMRYATEQLRLRAVSGTCSTDPYTTSHVVSDDGMMAFLEDLEQIEREASARKAVS